MDITIKTLVLGSLIFSFTVFASVPEKPKSESDRVEIRIPFEKTVLSNGLSVITVEDPSAKLLSYQTWFQVGSVDEIPGLTGVSHLFEHFLFKGTQKFPPRKFFQILEKKGASFNAYSTRDYLVFHEEFVPEPGLLETVMDIEADRMTGLNLDEAALNNERMIVFEERRLKMEAGPEPKMLDVLWQLAYRRHPYQWPVMGNPVDILNMTPAFLTDFYKSYFQPGNATLVIVGNFKTKDLLGMVKKYYGRIPGRPKPKKTIPVEPPQGEERRLVLREKTPFERFAVGYHISKAEDDDSYALDVLASLLFEGSSARAKHRLIEELNLVNSISGSAYTPVFPGMFIIYGSMRPGHSSAEMESELWRLIKDIQEKSVTPQEVKTASKQLILQILDGLRTPHGVGQLLGTVHAIFKDPSRFAHEIERYQTITPDDVKRVAVKYFDPNNRTVVTVAPAK
ncbi:MAG: insulinase family protein [Bdellovibrio sp.]|nr:insulinase family protein [Bdellovibrio sp.]